MSGFDGRKLSRSERRIRALEAGAEALRQVALRYGRCVCVAGEPCTCDWESTKALIEKPVVP